MQAIDNAQIQSLKSKVHNIVKEGIQSISGFKNGKDRISICEYIKDTISEKLKGLGFTVHKAIFVYKVDVTFQKNSSDKYLVKVLAVLKTPTFNVYIKNNSAFTYGGEYGVSAYFDSILTTVKKGLDSTSVFVENTFKNVKDYRERCQKVSQLTDEYFFGIGPENHEFKNDEIANSFTNAWKINKARDFFYRKVNEGRDVIHNPITGYGCGFGLMGLLHAGIDPVEQFVGTYRITHILVKGKILQYTLTNETSTNSLLYDLGPSWSRASFKPMGTVSQTFVFTESIDFNRVKNRKFLKP